MISFAEFTRLRWMQLSMARLIVTPVIFLVILGLCVLLSPKHQLPGAVYAISYGLYFFMVIISGSRNAQRGLRSELSQNTWITQQMTALTATEMTLGKLFGSTIFNWYCAAYLLTALTLSKLATSSVAETSFSMYLLLVITLLCHVYSLLAQTETEWSKKVGGGLVWLVFVVVGGQIILMAEELPTFVNIYWWGMPFSYHWFLLYTLTLYCIWGVIGLIRAFMSLLQYQSGPAAWTLFLLFNCFFYCGFVSDSFEYQMLVRLLLCFVILSSSTYVMAFIELYNPLQFKRWYRALSHGQLKSLYYATPRWLPSLVMMLGVAILIPFFMPSSEIIESLSDVPNNEMLSLMQYFLSGVAPLAFAGYCIRDIGILFLSRNRRKNTQRADITFTITLAIIYLLVPALLSGLGITGLYSLCFLDISAHPIVMIGVPYIEAFIILGILAYRLKPLLTRE